MDSLPAGENALRQYAAARAVAGIASMEDWALLRVAGPDNRAFLQGLLSNDVLSLDSGPGQMSCLLTAKGRIRAHVILCRIHEEIIAVGESISIENMAVDLGRFAPLSRVTLQKSAATEAPIFITGPRAPEIVSSTLGFKAPAALIHDPRGLAAGLWVLASGCDKKETFSALLKAGRALGGEEMGREAMEMIRIENAWPSFAAELSGDVFPQEAGLDSAVSFSKGCYLGQEIMSRLRYRGQASRLLVRLKIPGISAPSAGARVLAQGRESGTLLSITWSPRHESYLGFAFLRREDAENKPALEIVSAGGERAAEVIV
ncbi:MAG: CAF17-like 4Fe-4S cluster assembly/insertion protein YgfZ [Elusimicrobiota bacterium]